jgi:hypothetical protein
MQIIVHSSTYTLHIPAYAYAISIEIFTRLRYNVEWYVTWTFGSTFDTKNSAACSNFDRLRVYVRTKVHSIR